MAQALTQLKSTAFGGFDKESVLRYLRDMAAAHNEETQGLQGQIERLQQQVDLMCRSGQQEQEQRSVEQVGRIAEAIQQQSKSLERLLEENRRLQAEVDSYRAREEAIQELEQRVQGEAEALRAQVRSECQQLRRSAAREAEELVRELTGKLGAMSQLSEEFSALCRKSEQLLHRQP